MKLGVPVSLRRLVTVLVWMLCSLLGCAYVRADTPVLCTETDYKVASPTVIAVQCEENVSNLVGSAQLYESGTAPLTPLQLNISVTAYAGASQWLVLELTPAGPSGPQLSLQPGKKYKVALFLHPQAQPLKATTTPTTFDIETNNTVAVSPAIAISKKSRFEFVSHLGYKTGPSPSCSLQVEDFSKRVKTIGAHDCRLPAPISDPARVSAANITRLAPSPEDIGSFLLTLDSGNKDTQQLPIAVVGLMDIFDKSVKIDPKSQLAPEKAPASKDASKYYINLNYAGGRGTKPGWVLDGKISPPIGTLHHGFRFSPLASADVGQNQVNSIRYTDTINFGASFIHMYEPNDVLQGLLFGPGITYETDKEFDRHNLLATPDFRFNFVGLYNTRLRRTLKKFSKELEVAQSNKIPWSRENSKPVLVGYALDFHTGFEMGSALADTTVKASVGKMSLKLPSYHIARLAPQVHGLLEMGRFSLDVTATARYLTTVENTVLERPDHSLFLKRIHGWYGYGVITGSWNFDPAGHFALTVSYKDGFSPPKFSRVNTVQSGITLKY